MGLLVLPRGLARALEVPPRCRVVGSAAERLLALGPRRLEVAFPEKHASEAAVRLYEPRVRAQRLAEVVRRARQVARAQVHKADPVVREVVAQHVLAP